MTLDTINFSTTAKPKRRRGALSAWEKPYRLPPLHFYEIDEGDGLVRLVVSAPSEQANTNQQEN